jgi:Arc/MetJ-type ribon-helix-helix transcriptional regulator
MTYKKEVEERRTKVSATLPPDLYSWIEKRIKSRRFHNMSHALEVCILEAKELEENGKRIKG